MGTCYIIDTLCLGTKPATGRGMSHLMRYCYNHGDGGTYHTLNDAKKALFSLANNLDVATAVLIEWVSVDDFDGTHPETPGARSINRRTERAVQYAERTTIIDAGGYKALSDWVVIDKDDVATSGSYTLSPKQLTAEDHKRLDAIKTYTHGFREAYGR